MSDFHSLITNFSAKEILRAFPGMPPSTAYGWQKGIRQPPEWLQPTIIEKIATKSNPPENLSEKQSDGSLPEWFQEWIIRSSPISEGKMENRVQEIVNEFPEAVKALIDAEFGGHIREWVKESAIRLNPDQSLKEEEEDEEPLPRPVVKSIFDEIKDNDD